MTPTHWLLLSFISVQFSIIALGIGDKGAIMGLFVAMIPYVFIPIKK